MFVKQYAILKLKFVENILANYEPFPESGAPLL
jgi:hypothetical protein